MIKKQVKANNGNDLKWFSQKFSKKKMDEHAGEWVALKNKQVLASGASINIVVKKAEKIVEAPILVKIPKKEEVLIL